MIHRCGLSFFLLACGAFAAVAAPAKDQRTVRAAADRPNIIFFLTDDMRWDSMGCVGNPIVQTPNLDRLATEGTLFRNCFCTTSICAVSRASFLTGQYERRHRIDDFDKPLTPDAFAKTFPALLRGRGYHTGFVGKYGIGKNLPKDGFDVFDGFAGQGRYFEPGDPEHITRKMTRKMLAFLDHAPADKPFLLCVSFKAPHCQDGFKRQFQPDPVYDAIYQDVTIPPPATATEEAFAALPPFLRHSENRTRWHVRFATEEAYQSSAKNYYRLVTGVDAAVGKVMAQLRASGADQRTVVIFTSDNGFFLGEHGLAGKWLMYEQSIRLPLLIRDPSIPDTQRGRQVDAMALTIDIAPTILDLAGLQPEPVMQGQSLRPWLNGRTVPWRDDFFYEYHFDYRGRIAPCEGVRGRRFKYIRYLATDPIYESLFDLAEDPNELRDLGRNPEYQDVLMKMRARWQELAKEAE